jgi:calcium permeable stress-gated cation channel
LNTDYKDRLKACKKLEKAASKLIMNTTKAKAKDDKLQEKQRKKQRNNGNSVSKPAEEYGLEKHENDTQREYIQPSPESPTLNVPNKDAGTIEHGSDLGRPSYASSRPLRSRTTTSELEEGRLPPSPTFSHQNGSISPQLNAGNGDKLSAASKILEMYAPPNLRPRHRTGFLGLLGKKVDTIEWCKVGYNCTCNHLR